MGFKDITPGTRKATIIAGRFIKTEKNRALEIAIDFEEPSTKAIERMYWQGWLSEKAIENTMETLVDVCDYNGSEEVDENGNLTDPSAIAIGKEVSIVIELDTRMKDGKAVIDSKTFAEVKDPRIKWLNNVGGGGGRFEGIAPEVLKADLQSIGFKAAFMAAKNKSGKPQEKAPPPEPKSDIEIPF